MTPGGGANGYATFQFLNVKGHSYDTWKNATNVEDATTSFCYSFERPNNPEGSLTERKKRAQKYYDQFHGKELFEGAKDSIKSGEHTFPHYLQKNYSGSYGDTTIALGGCAPTSLAMVLAGITRNPGITPVTVINSFNEYYGSWTNYYQANGGGTRIRKILGDADFLKKYYNVKATEISSQESIIAQLTDGKAAIGSTPGHILAVIPVPEQYREQGYRFYVLDSANGLSGAYRTVDEVRRKPYGSGFKFNWLLEPI